MKTRLCLGYAILAAVGIGPLGAVTIVTSVAEPFEGEETLAAVVGGFASDAVEVFPETFQLGGRYQGEIIYQGTTPIADPTQVYYLKDGGAPVSFLSDMPLGQIAEVVFAVESAYGFMVSSPTDGTQYSQDILNGGRKQAIILHSASTGAYFIGFENISINSTTQGDFNDLVLRLQPVPEPSGAVLVLMGAGLLASSRSRSFSACAAKGVRGNAEHSNRILPI